MSCNIHLFAEKNVDDKWVHAQDADVVTRVIGATRFHEIPWEKELYQGQGYETFAILAGVRNYFDIIPIMPPRGLPNNLSPFVKEQADLWESDGYSHSYLSLRELQEFNWSEHTFTIRTFVTHDEAKAYRENGVKPSSYSRIDARIDDGDQLRAGHEILQWEETYAEEAQYILERVLPRLEEFGSLDEIRIVFWFDG